MRTLFLFALLFLPFSSSLAQSITLQHKVQPNATYRMTLALTVNKKSEKIQDYDKNGVAIYDVEYKTSLDSSLLVIQLTTSSAVDGSIPFVAVVDSMYHWKYSKNRNGDSITIFNEAFSDVRIYGRFSSFDRMVVDSIDGTSSEEQYNFLFNQLDMVYRSMRMNTKPLSIGVPQMKETKTKMLKSFSNYTLTEIEENQAFVQFEEGRYGMAKGEETDKTDTKGTIGYDIDQKMLTQHSFQKVFNEITTYVDATTVLGIQHTTNYDWTFEKLD